jgi:biotin synthase
LPRSIIRLSAGRTEMSDETQALCFLAGANSIFLGEKLLTTPNPEKADDFQLLQRLGLHALNPEDARRIHRAATPEEQDAWAASCSSGCSE